jgi:hypothetical protein
VSEDADGAADLEDVFGAGLLLVGAGGRRVGIAGSGGSGFLAEDILMPGTLLGPFLVLIRGRIVCRCKVSMRQWLDMRRTNVIYMPIAERKSRM